MLACLQRHSWAATTDPPSTSLQEGNIAYTERILGEKTLSFPVIYIKLDKVCHTEKTKTSRTDTYSKAQQDPVPPSTTMLGAWSDQSYNTGHLPFLSGIGTSRRMQKKKYFKKTISVKKSILMTGGQTCPFRCNKCGRKQQMGLRPYVLPYYLCKVGFLVMFVCLLAEYIQTLTAYFNRMWC